MKKLLLTLTMGLIMVLAAGCGKEKRAKAEEPFIKPITVNPITVKEITIEENILKEEILYEDVTKYWD